MKVAIDSGPLTSGHSVRGVGHYAKELIKSLNRLSNKDIQIFVVDFGKEDLSKYDVAHYTSFHPFFQTLPSGKPTKTVVTIHDLIPLVYPKHYPPGIKGSLRFLVQKYLAKKADAIITVSETSKKDIVRFLGIDPEKIQVIYLAAGTEFGKINVTGKLKKISKKYSLPRKFVMYLGDVNYNKNLPTLVSACRMAEAPLVICGKQAKDIEEQGQQLNVIKGPQDYLRYVLGKPHPELAHFVNLNKLLKNSKGVYRLGFVADGDLPAIFNLATVYVQPSFYEGFGLPVLQAFSCGTPVIISKTNCLVEIAGGAALIADPNNPKDMASKILSLFPDTSQKVKMVRDGIRRANQFSWEKTAKETIKVYEEVVSNK